jgi:hypothetical protein
MAATSTMTTPYGINYKFVSALTATATTLPLANGDAGSLATKIGATGHAWLTISDPIGAEVVKASVFNGQILIERGQDGSTARVFPAGSCVDARMTSAAVKDLICNYDCCATSPC